MQNPVGKAAIGLAWLLGLRKNGLGSTNHFEAGAFLRSDPTRRWPDVQMHFLPAAMRYDGTKAFRGHGYQVHVGANKPKSRGRIAIRSADPDAEPEILFNYLGHRDDVRVWRRCIRLTREIMDQPAFDAYRGAEIQPGRAAATDADLDPLAAAELGECLPPVVHLQDGARRRSAGGGGRAVPGSRPRTPARSGRFGLPFDSERQPQCADHHGRRTRRRPDPRQEDDARAHAGPASAGDTTCENLRTGKTRAKPEDGYKS